MLLVDYASSSSDDEEEIREAKEELLKKPDEFGAPPPSQPPPPHPSHPPPNPQNENFIASSRQRLDAISPLPPPSIERLPDVSLLLSSPSLPSDQVIHSDHASRVAAAMAESASRKRESNGSPSHYPRSKYPRGRLPHSRNVPDTMDGLVIPPQLRGRSNVVTEDIHKLFVSSRNPESSH